MPIADSLWSGDPITPLADACGHPHILGSECVLQVADAAETIRRKVDEMLRC